MVIGHLNDHRSARSVSVNPNAHAPLLVPLTATCCLDCPERMFCSTGVFPGGGDGTRTHDPLLAKLPIYTQTDLPKETNQQARRVLCVLFRIDKYHEISARSRAWRARTRRMHRRRTDQSEVNEPREVARVGDILLGEATGRPVEAVSGERQSFHAVEISSSQPACFPGRTPPRRDNWAWLSNGYRGFGERRCQLTPLSWSAAIISIP